jgi:hypothetical protein
MADFYTVAENVISVPKIIDFSRTAGATVFLAGVEARQATKWIISSKREFSILFWMDLSVSQIIGGSTSRAESIRFIIQQPGRGV